MAGFYADHTRADANLTNANLVLRETREEVGAIAQVGSFLGQLLDVRSARFESSLNTVARGQVSMDLDLVFMNQSRKIRLAFNFNNPISSAKALGESLLPA